MSWPGVLTRWVRKRLMGSRTSVTPRGAAYSARAWRPSAARGSSSRGGRGGLTTPRGQWGIEKGVVPDRKPEHVETQLPGEIEEADVAVGPAPGEEIRVGPVLHG